MPVVGNTADTPKPPGYTPYHDDCSSQVKSRDNESLRDKPGTLGWRGAGRTGEGRAGQGYN